MLVKFPLLVRPASTTEELTGFMTRSEVEARLKREREKASISSIYMDLEALTLLTVKPYPVWYVASEFQKVDGRRGNTREHGVHFLDGMGAHAPDTNLCMRKFSKSFKDGAYTCYVNLKPGSMHN